METWLYLATLVNHSTLASNHTAPQTIHEVTHNSFKYIENILIIYNYIYLYIST